MNYVSIGDMAQSFQLRSHNTQLQRTVQTLSAEMTSGTKADLAAAVSGDFRALAGIDRSLGTLDAFRTATAEAALLTATVAERAGHGRDIPVRYRAGPDLGRG